MKVPEIPVTTLSLVLNTLDPDHDIGLAADYLRSSASRIFPKFGIFGYMAHHKRIPDIVHALVELSQKRRFLAVFGGSWQEGLLHKLEPELQSLVRSGHAIIWNRYIDREEMLRMMVDCDFVFSMRYPTAGESSGIAAECNALAVPVIFNPFSGFSDLDDSFNIPVPIDADNDVFIRTIEQLVGSSFGQRKAIRAARIKEARAIYEQACERYGATVYGALRLIEETSGPTEGGDLRKGASMDPSAIMDISVKVCFSGRPETMTFRPKIPIRSFASEADAADRAGRVFQGNHSVLDTAGSNAECLVFLRRPPAFVANAKPKPIASAEGTGTSTLLSEFVSEVEQLPLFAHVFVPSRVLRYMVDACSKDRAATPILRLLHAARPINNQMLFLNALGLQVRIAANANLVHAVKISRLISRELLDIDQFAKAC